MKTFKDYVGYNQLNEKKSNKEIAKEFLDYISYMDFSDYDWDMDTTAGIEDYLDTIKDEGGDSKYELEKSVAKINDIENAMPEIENRLKNGKKIDAVASKIKKYESELAKLKKELDRLS
jgi:uncharacterized protein Yka (UPF0111/DUF47 family)